MRLDVDRGQKGGNGACGTSMYFGGMKGSFTATTCTLGLFWVARITIRPMRPKPLMPMRIGADMLQEGWTRGQ